MKSFKVYLTESLTGVKLDSEQVFLLYSNKIDEKAFAMNCDIDEDDAKFISDILKSKKIVIVSSDQMKDRYDKSDIDKYLSDPDALVDLGIRYGTQLSMDDDERKQYKETGDRLAKEKGEEPEKHDETVNDFKFVAQVNADYTSVQPENVVEFFWKKAGNSVYLYFILDTNDDIDKFISKL